MVKVDVRRVCSSDNKCGTDSYLALDSEGVNCVSSCEGYFETVGGEKQCRSGCPDLYVEEKDLTECVS